MNAERLPFLLAVVASMALGAEPLRFVVTPYRPAAELKQAYRPLADRLSARVKQPMEIVVADSFGAAAEMLVDGRADLGELTPYAFISGMQRATGDAGHHHLVPLAADAMVGRPGTGVIIVATSSSARSLEELKGVRFGFVDEYSSTGFLGPWAMMQAKGLNPKTFLSSWSFLGSHTAVVDAVIKGSVDAGAISRHTLETMVDEKKRAKVRVVVETARMPGDVVCARAELPAHVRAALEQELLALSWDTPADRAVLEPILRKAFVKVDLKDYGWLQRVAASVKAK